MKKNGKWLIAFIFLLYSSALMAQKTHPEKSKTEEESKITHEDVDKVNHEKMDYFHSVFNNFSFQGAKPLHTSNYMFNLSLGIPAAQVPLYTNTQISGGNGGNINFSSTTTVSSILGYYFAGELHLLNNKFIDLRGFGSYWGSLSLSSVTNGTDFLDQSYYGGEIGIGYKRLKLYGGYAAGSRSVSTSNSTYNEISNISSTTSGYGNYNFKRLIAGIAYHFDDEEKERFVRINVLKESPDYKQNDLIWGAGLQIRGWLTVEAEYFPTYPAAGSYYYKLDEKSNKALWQVSISKTITIFNGRY